MMFPGESSITAGEFFQNHEKYTSRACPFLSWALVGRVTTHQKTSQTRCVSHVFQTDASNAWDVFKPSQRMIAGRHAAIRGLKCWKKDEQRAQLEVDGSWWGSGFSANSEVFWIFASFYIFNLDISDASGQMVIYLSVILTVNQNLQILAGAPKGWHFWGPFPAGVGQASLGIAMAAMDDGKSTDDQSIMDLFASNCVGSLFLQIV